MTTSGALRVGLVTISLLVGACSADEPSTADRAVDESTTTTASPVDLAAVLVGDGPPRLARLPDGQAGAGPLDIDAAAELSGGKPARDGLERLGFVRGHVRSWGNTDPIEAVLLKVEEFGDTSGASQWLDLGTGTLEDRFAVDAIPESVGFEAQSPAANAGAHRVLIAFAKGPRVYTLVWDVKGSASRRAEAIELATRQYANAP